MAGPLPFLRLLRAGTLFSPAADVVAGLCIAGAATGNAVWSVDAVRAVLASALLYGGGMVCNDVADRREDAVQRPERPLPRGDVALPAAVALGAALLLGGVCLSPYRGYHGAIAVLVLAYDFVCKRRPLPGVLAMGTLRALNLAVASAPLYPSLPVPLLAAAVCYGGYVAAITLLGIQEDLPAPRARTVVAARSAPPLLALLGLVAVQGAPWPAPLLALPPVLWFLWQGRATTVWDRPAIRRSMTHLLLGTMLYTALLCVAVARPVEAIAIALCIPLARAVTRRLQFRTMS